MTRPVFPPSTNLTNGGEVGQQLILAPLVQEGYKQFAYEQMRENFAQGLLEAIERCRHPVVVEISENERPEGMNTMIEIRARLTPVKYTDFTIPRVSFTDPVRYDNVSWKKRLKFFFSGNQKDLE